MVIIKKLWILFLSCLLLFSLTGCSDNKAGKTETTQLENPPALKIIYQDQSINAVTGTYSWTTDNKDGTKKTVNADSSAPPELVKNLTSLKVSPKSSLTLSFGSKTSDITVNIWQDKNVIKQALVDGKIVMPETKGLVIYEVIVTYEQGTVYYAFLVNVN